MLRVGVVYVCAVAMNSKLRSDLETLAIEYIHLPYTTS